MVPITVVTGHLLVSMHLSSQHLCKIEQRCYPPFTDRESKHREILDSDAQLTVVNTLTMSHRNRNRQDLHPCLAVNAKQPRLKWRVMINALPHTTLSMAIEVNSHRLPSMTGQEQTHNYHCSADMRLLALSSQFHIHMHRVCGMAGNQTTSPVSQEGDPIHWDFFIQLILFPTLSTADCFLAGFPHHKLHFPFKRSHPEISIPVIAMILLSLCLKLSICCLSKLTKMKFQ